MYHHLSLFSRQIVMLLPLFTPTILAYKSALPPECLSAHTSSYDSRAWLECRRDVAQDTLTRS